MLGIIMMRIPRFLFSSAPTDDGTPGAEIVLPAKRRWSVALIAMGVMMNLAQTSLAGSLANAREDAFGFAVAMLSLFVGTALPFLLLHRDRSPMLVLAVTAGATVLLPLGSTSTLLSLSALTARSRDRRLVTIGTTLTVMAVAASYTKDLLRPADWSMWKLLFSDQGTGVNGVPARLNVGMTTIVAAAAVWGVGMVAAAVMVGLHLRARALAHNADAKVHAERSRADELASNLQTQRFADAVAAEAHDTLAHSLSLIAVNASAMQTQTMKLASQAGDAGEASLEKSAKALVARASEIRRQAAGALDEAHSIIDMLRHPEEAEIMLAPAQDTALTREALYDIVDSARSAGMPLDTWIDVRDLSSLNPQIGKIAFRAVQEGLTNARRHAPGKRVSLEISAIPSNGVVVLFSNATEAGLDARENRRDAAGIPNADVVDTGLPDEGASGAGAGTGGHGLAGLKERVMQAGGTCEYGYDARNDFHLDVKLPFVPLR